MSFNESELVKIRDKTSGWFKGKARSAIADAINLYKPKIAIAKSLSNPERQKAILALINQATGERNTAIQSGANSYSNPDWAAAATIESWLHELMEEDHQGIVNVEIIIDELQARA